jgi:hypothetical protein
LRAVSTAVHLPVGQKPTPTKILFVVCEDDMSGHSKGPWFLHRQSEEFQVPDRHEFSLQNDANAFILFDVLPGDPCAAANARLIAAAPDLLDELQNMTAICSMAAPDHDLAIARAKAAIAKATGEDL